MSIIYRRFIVKYFLSWMVLNVIKLLPKALLIAIISIEKWILFRYIENQNFSTQNLTFEDIKGLFLTTHY